MSRNRRQELYDRIRESSMDEVTLEEMIRHGFWDQSDPLPSASAELIERRGELQREINGLAKDARAYRSQESALRELMQERMREAKQKRIETKRRHIAERNQRAADWHQKKTEDIVDLGEGHAPALQQRASNTARLAQFGLPTFADMPDIAKAMGVELGELRFLAYDRAAAKTTHYKRFRVPKKSGGWRILSAPMPRLKRAQYWVLDNIVGLVEPHDAAHGFRPGRSILTNATPHARQAVVVNYDLKDFFPSIAYRRVKGLFASFGYAEAQSALFALLCTEADREEVEMDGQTWHVAAGERVLPQGAPTSPAITNLLCRRLDRRLAGTARKLGFAYTRYADDLTFSRPEDDAKALKQLDWSVRKIIEDEGFVLNDAKTRVMRRGDRQEVTGITVNDGLTISRQERRKFRAYLHNTEQGRETGSFRSGAPRNSALGYAQFLSMVQGNGVSALVERARRLFGASPAAPWNPEPDHDFRARAAAGQSPKETWWTPAPPVPPTPEVDPYAEAEKREAAAAATEVPRVGSRPPGQSGRSTRHYQRRRNTGPETDTIPGLRVSSGWKIVISIVALILAAPLPGSLILAGVAIYFIWFHNYGRRKE